MPIQLTLDDLGVLVECECCHKPTYHPNSKPVGSRWHPGAGDMLPEGLTVGNYRMWVKVGKEIKTVGQNCRYDVYGAY